MHLLVSDSRKMGKTVLFPKLLSLWTFSSTKSHILMLFYVISILITLVITNATVLHFCTLSLPLLCGAPLGRSASHFEDLWVRNYKRTGIWTHRHFLKNVFPSSLQHRRELNLTRHTKNGEKGGVRLARRHWNPFGWQVAGQAALRWSILGSAQRNSECFGVFQLVMEMQISTGWFNPVWTKVPIEKLVTAYEFLGFIHPFTSLLFPSICRCSLNCLSAKYLCSHLDTLALYLLFHLLIFSCSLLGHFHSHSACLSWISFLPLCVCLFNLLTFSTSS